jgi:hypothetical protein
VVWPNDEDWKALADGELFDQDGTPIALSVVDCGELVAPVGRLVVSDPFMGLEPAGNAVVAIPPGRYPVKVTLADVSGSGDGSHVREAYATLLLSDAPEVTRRVIPLVGEGEEAPTLDEGEFVGFPVGAGTACFVDEGTLAAGMPAPDTWYDEVFESGEEGDWFSRMDDPAHIREGIANVPLPLATDGANVVLVHSGWGDGVYPVVGGYDAEGRLVRVHVDFMVVGALAGEAD